MLKIPFICPLENGLHARPASELEQRVSAFAARIELCNLRNQRRADARSVLAMIGADVVYQDPCELVVDGLDEDAAYQMLSRFIHDEFAGCDTPVVAVADRPEQPLPVFLAQTTSPFVCGSGVSSGLAQGEALLLGTVDLHALAQRQEPEEPAAQHEAMQHALAQVRLQLRQEHHDAQGDAAAVLLAHIKLLDDALLESALLAPRQQRNAVAALAQALDELCAPLRESRSAYLRQRVLDLQDLGLRLAAHLTAQPLITLAPLQQDTIVISPTPMTPGQLLALRGPRLKGIIMGDGGETSHTVILARSFGIPLLSVSMADSGQIPGGEALLLDARHGVAILSPDGQAQRWYQLETEKYQRIANRLQPFIGQPGVMQDGERVALLANIALAVEAEAAFAAGAQGIGLFRTEMLFCERSSPPDEEEQYQAYRQVLEQAQGRKVVIRTLDIGGDKPCDYLNLPEEENPFLGWRGVRLYPALMALFSTQMRALLRASAAGPLHIMAPMVATLEEVKWLHTQFQQTQAELTAQGVATGTWSLGIMAEVPSVLYILDKAAAWIDFISIGSNDLAQYFLACDRGNASVRHLYNYFDPAFLQLLQEMTARAHRAGLEISLCGEMGGDLQALPLLLGAGLRHISMSASRIGSAKAQLATLSVAECQQMLQQAVAGESAQEVVALLKKQSITAYPVFDPRLILLDLAVDTKAEVIKRLTDNLEIEQRVRCGAEVEAAIWQREAIFSTALGFAIALPHCKSPAVTSSSVSVMRLASPLAWNEEVSVSLVIMLTVSEQEKDDHMKIFSRLARKLMHADFRQQLLEGNNPQAVAELLQRQIAL
ncbi:MULTISPECIES: phosphoenolpyruvate--protein phosphotransferase [Raoultella]|uniref:phosphoenolpyruvate--protein phosphotransferase n=1 Tax=Raoultella TaxID=160674 RepID=UPI002168F478|nr:MULTISPECIES: phosphoenolpyruvate--protein phosphotransferase [Raoultella]MCS4274332.1 fructose-specific PTS system IIA-like component [Raoultella sp. BIGb0132]MCS4291250.1 fructose-specific PTS system IIA-like component [Raoultella terrigena]